MWPLYQIDSRVICLSPFRRKLYDKIFSKGDIDHYYSRKNYCTIALEFPQFVKPLNYVTKTPQSYKDFLRFKYSDEKVVNTKYEIHSVFSNTIEDLDEIFQGFSNRERYFLNMREREKFESTIKKRLAKREGDFHLETHSLRRSHLMKEEDLTPTQKYYKDKIAFGAL